jgi:hypothetical protein
VRPVYTVREEQAKQRARKSLVLENLPLDGWREVPRRPACRLGEEAGDAIHALVKG